MDSINLTGFSLNNHIVIIDYGTELHVDQSRTSTMATAPLPHLSEPNLLLFTQNDLISAQSALDSLTIAKADNVTADTPTRLAEKTVIIENAIDHAATSESQNKIKCYKKLLLNILELSAAIATTTLLALGTLATGGLAIPLFTMSSLLLVSAITNVIFSSINVVRVHKDLSPIKVEAFIQKGVTTLFTQLGIPDSVTDALSVKGFGKLFAGLKIAITTTQTILGLLFLPSSLKAVMVLWQFLPLVLTAAGVIFNFTAGAFIEGPKEKVDPKLTAELKAVNTAEIAQAIAKEILPMPIAATTNAVIANDSELLPNLASPAISIEQQESLIVSAQAKINGDIFIHTLDITQKGKVQEERVSALENASQAAKTINGKEKAACYRELIKSIGMLLAKSAAVALLALLAIASPGTTAIFLAIGASILLYSIANLVVSSISLARVKQGLPSIGFDKWLRIALLNGIKKLHIFPDNFVEKINDYALTHTKLALNTAISLASMPASTWIPKPPLIDLLWKLSPIITNSFNALIDEIPFSEEDEIIVSEALLSPKADEAIQLIAKESTEKIIPLTSNALVAPKNALFV